METAQVVFKLSTWAEALCATLIFVMLASLAVLLACRAFTEAMNAKARAEEKKANFDTKALSTWMEAYIEEHELRIKAEKRAIQERRMRELLAKGVKE